MISPVIKGGKKVLMIRSSKYIYDYVDGSCKITPLPFDHPKEIMLLKEINNNIKVSLYTETITDHYRYIGKDGILKIKRRFLVYNYSPIPLNICGKMTYPR